MARMESLTFEPGVARTFEFRTEAAAVSTHSVLWCTDVVADIGRSAQQLSLLW